LLSVVIINFRSSGLIDECLRSLASGTRVPDEVIVVDSESRGVPPDAALAGGARLVFVPQAGNPGYAASCNAGARAASGDVLLFLNADIRVAPDCLERCLAVLASDPTVGIVGCRLVLPDGRLDHASHRGLPTPGASLAYKLRLDRLFPGSHRFARYTMAWLDPATDHDVEACSGAFMLMPRDALEAAGGWDERYRFYAEDLDLCLRVRRLGRTIRYVGTSSAVHLKGAFSHRAVPDEELDADQRAVKRWVSREVARSHRLFFEEHVRGGASWPVRIALDVMFDLQDLRLGLHPRSARS
jgi:GT2 family glycosyltransferase